MLELMMSLSVVLVVIVTYLLLVRPPDIRVGRLVFYHGFFLLYFVSYSPPSRRTELDQNRSHAWK